MVQVTDKQKAVIEKYQAEFEENLRKYDSWGSQQACHFGIYVSQNEGDKNVTLIITTISGLSDDYQPYKATNNIMVEPDGNSFRLKDIYPEDYIIEYIKALKKIN